MLVSCNNFLDIKPDSKMAIIESKQDLWTLLDNELVFNSVSVLGEDLADNYYVSDQTWNSSANQAVRNKYVWNSTENDDIGWSVLYSKVYNANVVLEGTETIKREIPENDYREIMGTALFYRSLFFYELLSVYAMPYKIGATDSYLGIPLRTTADINQNFQRSTVKESLDLILRDMEMAGNYLKESSGSITRPSRLAVWSQMARIYLDIADYDHAMEYAGKVLDLADELLDYNLIDQDQKVPFDHSNREVLHLTYGYSSFLTQSRGIVDSTLYKSYAVGDRRKGSFFTTGKGGTTIFKGSYTQGAGTHFTGTTTAEMYLVFIESAIKKNRLDLAQERLLFYLGHRYASGSAPSVDGNRETLLKLVHAERRKELVFRNRRWNDVKRFNLEGEDILLRRSLNGKSFEIPANSNRYAMLIPIEVIKLGGIIQNDR